LVGDVARRPDDLLDGVLGQRCAAAGRDNDVSGILALVNAVSMMIADRGAIQCDTVLHEPRNKGLPVVSSRYRALGISSWLADTTESAGGEFLGCVVQVSSRCVQRVGECRRFRGSQFALSDP
jgi:hypothetical protein